MAYIFNQVSRYFQITIDQVVNFDGSTPQEVTIVYKTLKEQTKMIRVQEPEEKSRIFKMVDTYLTKKKFKEFSQKNVATL